MNPLFTFFPLRLIGLTQILFISGPPGLETLAFDGYYSARTLPLNHNTKMLTELTR